MTKFVIESNGNLVLRRRMRKDNISDKWKDTRLGKIKKTEPIFKHPITAIAFQFENNYSLMGIPTGKDALVMDKRDILHALDFWINDKVLENERLLFLEDSLRDVDEIELKNLIKMRQEIDKMPSKSQFTRIMSNTLKYRYTKFESWLVEFYQQISIPVSHITKKVYGRMQYHEEQNFRGDGARFDFSDAMGNLAGELTGYFAVNTNTEDEVSGMMGGGRHSGSSATFGGNAHNDLSRILSRVGAGTDATNSNPNTWMVGAVRGTNGNVIYRVNDRNGRIVASAFTSAQAAQRYISEHIDRSNNRQFHYNHHGLYYTMDSNGNIHTNMTQQQIIESEFNHNMTFPGHRNGIVHSRLRTEDSHPSFTREYTTQFMGSSTEIRLPNMHLSRTTDSLSGDPNSYTMVGASFHNPIYNLECQIYVTTGSVDRVLSSWIGGRDIVLDTNPEHQRLMVGDHRLLLVSYELHERPNPIHAPRQFNNMYVNRITSMAQALAAEHPMIYEVEFRDHDTNTDITVNIIRGGNTEMLTRFMNVGTPITLGLLPNNKIGLNGYTYDIHRPEQITIVRSSR